MLSTFILSLVCTVLTALVTYFIMSSFVQDEKDENAHLQLTIKSLLKDLKEYRQDKAKFLLMKQRLVWALKAACDPLDDIVEHKDHA